MSGIMASAVILASCMLSLAAADMHDACPGFFGDVDNPNPGDKMVTSQNLIQSKVGRDQMDTGSMAIKSRSTAPRRRKTLCSGDCNATAICERDKHLTSCPRRCNPDDLWDDGWCPDRSGYIRRRRTKVSKDLRTQWQSAGDEQARGYVLNPTPHCFERLTGDAGQKILNKIMDGLFVGGSQWMFDIPYYYEYTCKNLDKKEDCSAKDKASCYNGCEWWGGEDGYCDMFQRGGALDYAPAAKGQERKEGFSDAGRMFIDLQKKCNRHNESECKYWDKYYREESSGSISICAWSDHTCRITTHAVNPIVCDQVMAGVDTDASVDEAVKTIFGKKYSEKFGKRRLDCKEGEPCRNWYLNSMWCLDQGAKGKCTGECSWKGKGEKKTCDLTLQHTKFLCPPPPPKMSTEMCNGNKLMYRHGKCCSSESSKKVSEHAGSLTCGGLKNLMQAECHAAMKDLCPDEKSADKKSADKKSGTSGCKDNIVFCNGVKVTQKMPEGPCKKSKKMYKEKKCCENPQKEVAPSVTCDFLKDYMQAHGCCSSSSLSMAELLNSSWVSQATQEPTQRSVAILDEFLSEVP